MPRARILLSVALALAVVSPLQPARAAETREGRYVLSSPRSGGAWLANAFGTGIGTGYRFPAVNALPTSVRVVDVTGNPVGGVVAQDTDGDRITDVDVDFCGSRNITGGGFVKNQPIAVFVRSLDDDCPDPTAAIATTGTIFLTTG